MTQHFDYMFYKQHAECALNQHLPFASEAWADGHPPMSMVEAMNYSLLAGGKRLRPSMLLAAFHLFDPVIEKAYPFAAAIEMIHTYSLVHDDLPAMDNDDLRRGMPTSHVRFGEGNAILAGDALLNFAYETMAESEHPMALSALRVIARHAGVRGMIAGQAADLYMEKKATDLSMVQYMEKHKTADLFIAAIKAGLLLANASAEAVEAGEKYAIHFGLAFQICDDILDVTGDQLLMGKTIGKDVESGKMTWTAAVGIEKAREDAAFHTEQAALWADQFDFENRFFKTLAKETFLRVQ